MQRSVLYTAPTGGKTNISRWKGAGLQRVGGLCRTLPGNGKPLLPCADTGSLAIPTRGAPGSRLRAPARSRPQLGSAQPAPRAVSRSRAPGVVSGPQMVSQHRPPGRWLSNRSSGRTKLNISNTQVANTSKTTTLHTTLTRPSLPVPGRLIAGWLLGGLVAGPTRPVLGSGHFFRYILPQTSVYLDCAQKIWHDHNGPKSKAVFLGNRNTCDHAVFTVR